MASGEFNVEADTAPVFWQSGVTPVSGRSEDNENSNPHASSDHDQILSVSDSRGDDFSCRNCGESGHFARNCPNPPKSQACFNCGDEGYAKADCPLPRKGMECYVCGQEGHTKVECPLSARDRACYNCGEEGHNKTECTKPRVFKGTCRLCNKEGHPAAACPQRQPDVCKNCKAEGHKTIDCKENRKFDLSDIAVMIPEDAWAMMKKASDKRDLDDFRDGFKIYTKAEPEATFVDIEKRMRAENFNIYLIGLEREVESSMTLIDLQGKLDRTYMVGFFYEPTPTRLNLGPRWPRDAEDNLNRLADAGLPYDRMIPKCMNCGDLGHISRHCQQERAEVIDRFEIKCSNCGLIGHRIRDCKEKRRSKWGCRNCGSEDHIAADCTEPRSAENVECRKCNQMGHFAKDCPQGGSGSPRTCRNCGQEGHIARDCDKPRDASSMTCRNCDRPGHMARECPEPKNWSKVQCNQCGQMGHTVRRCPQAGESSAAAFPGDNFQAHDTQNYQADGHWGSSQGNQPQAPPGFGEQSGAATGAEGWEDKLNEQLRDQLW